MTGYIQEPEDIQIWVRAYARLAEHIRYGAACEFRPETFSGIVRQNDEDLADELGVTYGALIRFRTAVYAPLSGPAERTTEAPEG